jgi:hypothetical protein
MLQLGWTLKGICVSIAYLACIRSPCSCAGLVHTDKPFLVIHLAKWTENGRDLVLLRGCFIKGLVSVPFNSGLPTQPSTLHSSASFTMQLTLVLAIFAAFAAAGASLSETNAQRMARGLPPLPPVRRTPVEGTQPLILSTGTRLTLGYFQVPCVGKPPSRPASRSAHLLKVRNLSFCPQGHDSLLDISRCHA